MWTGGLRYMSRTRLGSGGLAALIIAVSAGMAAADTIYFKDGSALDGRVRREPPSGVILELPRGRMKFPLEDILRIEQNAKTGLAESEPASEPAPLPALSQEDRLKLRALLGALLTADPAERDAARQRIERFAQGRDVFEFFERALPYMPDRQAVEALQLLFDLDAPRSAPLLRNMLESNLPKNRAKALELLGTMHAAPQTTDPHVLRLFARGMLDHAEEVQVTAARALQALGDKRATPILIKGLESANPRVQRASLTALQSIWGTIALLGEVTAADAWRGLLSLSDEGTRTALDPEQLEPLVDAPSESDVDYNLAFE